MKKTFKIIITCIIFLTITTAIYATTEILPENKFGIKKVAILLAGVFLVVQILFIAYQKDKLEENIEVTEKKPKEELSKISKIEPVIKLIEKENILELNKNEELLKEEEILFAEIDTKIETIPEKMSPKKKNITLKKEMVVEKKEKPTNVTRSNIRRGNVKIVRERKKRDFEFDVKNKKQETKAISEAKKRITKEKLDAKKDEIKTSSNGKKRAEKIAKEVKKKNKK